jgi:putative phage-type endonuclease
MPKIIEGMEQNTQLWLEWRAKGLGGSDMDIVLNGSDLERDDLMHRILTGRKLHFAEHIQKAMQRGHDLEPVARKIASRSTASEFMPVCMEADFDPRFRVSLDGLSRNGRIVLEAKALAEKTHLDTLKKYKATNSAQAALPPRYYTQIQYQLMVSEADLALYAGYNPDIEANQFYMIPVEHDRVFQANIYSAAKAFFNKLDKYRGLPNIITISGYAQQGKDEVAFYLSSNYGYTRIGHADALKRELVELGVLGFPITEEEKKLKRQEIVDYSIAQKQEYGEDYWSERLVSELGFLTQDSPRIVIPDARYFGEIINARYLARQYGLTFASWGINRNNTPANEEERMSVGYALQQTDAMIDNTGTMDQLYSNVSNLITQYGR